MPRGLMKLGSIQYINSLPVDLGILSGAIPYRGKIVRGTPAQLNEKILRGDLDISPISVFHFAQNHAEFLMLPKLCISSESGVQSVLLFSRLKVSDLEDGEIAITGEGRTTPALLEMICRKRYGFAPQFKKAGPLAKDGIPKDADAILLIGDDALIAKEKYKNADIEVIDLAHEWRKWTKNPIVFAVWAVRRDFYEANPKETLDVCQTLLASRNWGIKNLDEILNRSMTSTNLSRVILKSYFKGLSYDFDKQLRNGMSHYLKTAVKCGLLDDLGEFEEINPNETRDNRLLETSLR